jgi:Cytochrome c7 and related cytochrome c
MKKVSILIAAIVIVAVAVVVAVAFDGNQVAAYPNGWAGGCGDCHNGSSGGVAPPAHTVPSHASIYPSNCSACHTAAIPTIDAGNCVNCHGSPDTIGNEHAASAGCTVSAACHGEETTTSTAPPTTATTAPPTTATTAPPTTATTAPPTTSTTAPPTTSTTAAPTTTTTVPSGEPEFTG